MTTNDFIKAFQKPWNENLHQRDIFPEVNRPAAVLLCLNPKESEPYVIFTERAHHLKHHAGQISFPGGKVENSDKGLEHTACREAEEEIGLSSELIKIVGAMPEYKTVSGFAVTPIVAYLSSMINIHKDLRVDENEVASVFEVPLSFLLSDENYETKRLTRKNQQTNVHYIKYQQHTIWGATAGMLFQLKEHILHK